ncbi:MAG: gliding motility-associated C-terminal domain-containing protein [Chitinophagaceae bacterium]
MKTACLTALLGCLMITASGQQGDAQRRDFINEIIARAARQPALAMPFDNISRTDIKMPAGLLLNPTSHQQTIKPGPVSQPAGTIKAKSPSTNSRPDAACKDSSYRRLIGIQHGYLSIQSVTQSKDGGMFLSATMNDSTLLPNPWWKSYGLLIKLDKDGNVLWLKQFDDLTHANYSFFSVMKVFELPNRDIICTAFLNNDANTNAYRTVIFRLGNTGNIIWRNCLQSDIGLFNSPTGTFTFWIESVAEGLNGDLVLCGTSNSNLASRKLETVVRLDNQGKLVWNANYGNHSTDGAYLFGSEGISAFVQNGQIILVGLSHGTNEPETAPAVNFLTLNYNNGALLNRRFFKPAAGFEKWFTFWGNQFTLLENGHYLFYGKLFSDLMHTATIKDHFGIIEFDASFNLVNAYTISSGLATNYYNDALQFDASGKGLISLLENLNIDETNIYFGSFHQQQFQNQRKTYYNHIRLPGNNGFAFLPGNAYGFVQSYFEDHPVTKSYIEFRKMHDSDTSSFCLGTETNPLRFLPLAITEDPTWYLLDIYEPNKMTELQTAISETDTLSSNWYTACRQTNYCDTLKIHSDPALCANLPSITFTAFKNAACGASVQWDINKAVLDSLQVLTDTSVTIWFKKMDWQGKLYASLPAGECFALVQDVIPVNITRLPPSQLNLGPDTVLCNSTKVILSAGNNFSAYQWQDGSTNAVLTADTPGIYWVKATDFCGNNHTDSIIIDPFNALINSIPDRIKCNNDTLHLLALPGFINYTWSNNYDINTLTGQEVVINPLTDTAYYLKAEKSPGCFAYDTIRIKVNQSAAINMGEDINFCSGDSAILHAAPGFDQYQWSNGSSSQQIFVFQTGSYSVVGLAANGCKSYDTVKVTVWTNPLVELDDNPQLCIGSSRTLQPGNYAAYLWQDGTISNSFTLHDIGIYYVTVTDGNHCTGSDTVRITTLLPAPVNFLPADTTICNYGNLLLQPVHRYDQYRWSNNASSPSINIIAPGVYWLLVTDKNHCTGRDSITVFPKECLNGFYIPNAFTPDNNGLNDFFKPIIPGTVEEYQFTIYNRWGQLIFTTKDLSKGWDGNFGGAVQATNVFAWICTYRLHGQAGKKETGKVVLIK